jgi:hypothetical protein
MLGVNTDRSGNAVSVARSTDAGFTWNQSDVLSAPAGCTFATGGCKPHGVVGWQDEAYAWLLHQVPAGSSWLGVDSVQSCVHGADSAARLCVCAGSVPVLLEQGSLFRGMEYW